MAAYCAHVLKARCPSGAAAEPSFSDLAVQASFEAGDVPTDLSVKGRDSRWDQAAATEATKPSHITVSRSSSGDSITTTERLMNHCRVSHRGCGWRGPGARRGRAHRPAAMFRVRGCAPAAVRSLRPEMACAFDIRS